MKCKDDNCDCESFMKIQAHSKDCNRVYFNNQEIMEGYAPGPEIGLDDKSGNDDVIFTYCIKCGKIQNDFPISILWCWENDHANYDCDDCPKTDGCTYFENNY